MSPPKRIDAALGFVAAFLLVAAVADAQDTKPAPTTRPATTSNAGMPLTGRITGVRGLVEVKVSERANWQPAKEGMIVDEGGEFRTGPRSAVQFVIDPDQTVTLDRLGTVKLLTAVRQATGKTKTDLGMKYGRTRYDISAGGVEHESTIRSPNSTLAVRGTKVSLTDTRPFPPEAVSLIGRAEFQSFKREVVAFGGKSKAKIDSSVGTAAGTALNLSVIDPTIPLARQPAEEALVADLLSRGSIVTVDRDSGIRIVRGGTVPDDKAILSLLPGNLNFVMRWTGNANLDMQITNASETLYPGAGLNMTPSGGRTAFDHQGGPHGGIEIASWPANFPRQFYSISANHVSGPTVTANVEVFLGGKLFPIIGFDFQGQMTQSTSVDFEVGPIPPGKRREQTLAGIVDLTTVPPPGGPGGVSQSISANARPAARPQDARPVAGKR